MSEVTVRELRNHGGDVIDRVAKGERVIITRAGKPVAELRPLASARVSAEVLLDRWRNVPVIDLERLREDLDSVVNPAL
ncbi:MAG: type II toxin-antitoxin system prevent-host-death family antitoxin [Chloroflexi bacterium]|jgi:prevent-host-death family protein|nr:type II toxin-antitoxin system prevent-host-death family antitoxin [Chloroflexota bacterium]